MKTVYFLGGFMTAIFTIILCAAVQEAKDHEYVMKEWKTF